MPHFTAKNGVHFEFVERIQNGEIRGRPVYLDIWRGHCAAPDCPNTFEVRSLAGYKPNGKVRTLLTHGNRKGEPRGDTVFRRKYCEAHKMTPQESLALARMAARAALAAMPTERRREILVKAREKSLEVRREKAEKRLARDLREQVTNPEKHARRMEKEVEARRANQRERVAKFRAKEKMYLEANTDPTAHLGKTPLYRLVKKLAGEPVDHTTPDTVRSLLAAGFTPGEVADATGVSPSTVSHIRTRRSHALTDEQRAMVRHVQGEILVGEMPTLEDTVAAISYPYQFPPPEGMPSRYQAAKVLAGLVTDQVLDVRRVVVGGEEVELVTTGPRWQHVTIFCLDEKSA